MKKQLLLIYTLWGLLWFWLVYLILFPLFVLAVYKKNWTRLQYWLHTIWGKAIFLFAFIPTKFDWRFKPKKGQAYVFCPNHTSYFDIPLTSAGMKDFLVCMGKKSLGDVPLFGYMFKNLHISVDRGSIRDSYKAFQQARDTVASGRNILMFPEGKTNKNNLPGLDRFKDGPFKVAIKEQIPIVPVTIPFNWIILPAHAPRLRWHLNQVIYHEPISTEGLTLDDAKELADKTYMVIYNELKQHFPDTIKPPVV